MNISSVKVGRGNLVTRKRQSLQKSLAKVNLSVIVIGCDNVETIRITTGKVEFGLRFKKIGLLRISLVRSDFLIIS